MAKATLNRQQANRLALLAGQHGRVSIEYDYGSKLIVSYGNVRRAEIWSTGKLVIDIAGEPVV